MMYNKADADLAKGLGLHMIFIWGRVALIQGIPILFNYNSILTIIFTLFVLLYYAYVFLIKNKFIPRMNQGSILVMIFVVITICYTLAAWPNNVQYFDPIGNTLVYEVLPFIILGMMTDLDCLYNPMVKASKILIILCAISSLGIAVNGHTTVSTWLTYSMPLSYATLYAVMWLLNDYFKEKKTSSLIFSIMGVLVLVIFGSRNTLLSVAAIISVNIMFRKEKNKLVKILLILAAVLVVIFWREVLELINGLAHTLGISSRTANLFLNQDFFADSRTLIHQSIFEVLNKHPFGVGIAGDVAQTQEFAHSLYVSILCTYGYFGGAIVMLILGIVLFKAYKKSYGLNRDILLIYILSVIPRGFTGGDIWSSDVFWWMLGIALLIIYRQKRIA